MSDKGFEVQGIDRKLINKLFRDEMRTYQPFNVMEWLSETSKGKDAEWGERYHHAKEDYLKRKIKADLEEKKQEIRADIEEDASNILEENYGLFIYTFGILLQHS